MSVLLAGCAAQDDAADDSSQDITGGNGTVESSIVYFLDGTDRAGTPRCAGAMIADTFAVTAKACVKEGMWIGQSTGSIGVVSKARVTTVFTPDDADADIAVAELDRAVPGARAVITHIPLRDGYTVNGFSSTSGTSANLQPASVRGQVISETDVHGAIIPTRGTQLCAQDIGSIVCSSVDTTSTTSLETTTTCGLSGIIVGPPETSTPAPAPATTTPSTTAPGTSAPAPAPAPVPAKIACSDGAWKVAELGRYAEFLRRFAPEAFAPIEIQNDFGDTETITPDGLWGFKTNGAVKACKIDTATLAPVATKVDAKLTAKVSFASMQERATAFGRFGIAPKSAPTQVRWFPARTQTTPKGTAFDVTFEGAVSADRDGDFVVLFRTSANGGESWTKCDLDGLDNGFNQDKILALKVGKGDPVSTAAPTTPPPSPQVAPAASDPGPAEDPTAGDGTSTSDPQKPADKPAKKKKASGCSAAPGPVSGGSNGAMSPVLGVFLGLGALLRRRASSRRVA